MNTKTFRMFVVDTDSYAGNFCREMCAYMTGRIGDCGVGSEEQDMFFEELGVNDTNLGPFRHLQKIISKENGDELDSYIDEDIGSEPDEFGVNHPCRVVSNPNWKFDGSGSFKRREDVSVQESLHGPWNQAAQLSFGIIFQDEIEKSQIAILKQRAQAYAEKNGIKIDGFREVIEYTIEFSRDV